MASAPSPPGRTRSQSSPARAASHVSCGSTTATFMPRSPTSSWEERTPTTSTSSFSSFNRRSVSMRAAQPMRQSKALPNIRSCSSSYSRVTSGTTGSPMRILKFSAASFALTAPMSMEREEISAAPADAFSEADIKCTGFAAMTPGRYFPSEFLTSTLEEAREPTFQPPKATKRRVPLGRMEWTIKPTSSLWASSMNTGLLPELAMRYI